jgi:hypothetical protein
VHVEVAAWMAGRAESLAAIGIFAALLAWGRWLETGRVLLLSTGAVALGFGPLAKETAIAGLPLAALLPWVWPTKRWRSPWPLWLAIGAAVGAYAGLRGAALGRAVGVTRTVPLGETIREVFGALGFYLRQLVWPSTTAPVLTTVPADGVHVALGAGALAGLAAGLALALWRRDRLATWAMAWVAFGLVPPLLLVVRAI